MWKQYKFVTIISELLVKGIKRASVDWNRTTELNSTFKSSATSFETSHKQKAPSKRSGGKGVNSVWVALQQRLATLAAKKN
jgi:hypothetical protein